MKKDFRSLEIIAKRYLDSYYSGIHTTLLKDSLIEVDVVREYQPGDRRLDSKSSLKTGKTMSRVFNPERSLNLFIILDISSSQYTKIDAAIITALYLCYLGEICGERIGICVFADRVVNFAEVTDDYASVIGLIEKSLNGLKMEAATNVEDSIVRVSNLFLRNSLVVFVSDFCYNLSNKMLDNIKKIATTPTNTVLSIALYNPVDWLLSLDQGFSVTFRDAESGTVGNYNFNSASSEFDKWSNELRRKFKQCNSESVFLDVKQEKFLLPLIKHFMRT